MKDLQAERSAPGRIPFISPLLHCAAMPALVYLRSSFGYVFLRPKSVFFAFSWAFVLFCAYAWAEEGMWEKHRSPCLFGAGALLLYWGHLFVAMSQQLYRRGEHDQYSGTSHLLRLLRALGMVGLESRLGMTSTKTEKHLQLWGEPLLVLLAATLLRLGWGERQVSWFLPWLAAAMLLKETLNLWLEVRRQKIQSDTMGDAREQGEMMREDEPAASEAPKATRKAWVKRQRSATSSAAEAEKERRCAELLRLLLPYRLEQAEENYRLLIKAEHPDTHNGSAESTSLAIELNEAVEYFRERLKG